VSLCFQLRWSGASVLSAPNGTKGLELIEAEKPDIVILDIGLPDMDGFAVLRELRRFSQVPVIMLTVRAEDTDVARGLELGADDYVSKPFSPKELAARVRAVLRRLPQEESLRGPAEIKCADITVNLARHEAYCGDRLLNLTPAADQPPVELFDLKADPGENEEPRQ
jgi:two-component system KDP operon response regulator KdpE